MALVNLEEFQGGKTYQTLYALDAFRNYWVKNEELIQEAAIRAVETDGPSWNPQTEEEHEKHRWEQLVARQFHDEVMTPTLRYSSIVMLYAIIERELLRIVKNIDPTNALKFGSSVLKPVAKFCETTCQLRLHDSPAYEAICDLQKIRDCVVHCRGDVGLSRDAKYLIALKAHRPGFYAWEETLMYIEPTCMDQFLQEAWQFFIWVFHELKWSIGDAWNGSRGLSCQSGPNH